MGKLLVGLVLRIPVAAAAICCANAVATATEGVDAPGLVREVRGKEKWIEQRPTLRVAGVLRRTKSEAAMVNDRQRMIDKGEPEKLPLVEEMGKPEEETVELVLDGERAYYRKFRPGREEVKVWDGKRGVSHLDFAAQRGLAAINQYFVRNDVKAAKGVMNDFVWPLAAPHKMWWGENAVLNPRDFKEEAFVYLRTEKYRGIECHVLLAKGHGERWSIGVKDRLLHRVEKGSLPDVHLWKHYAAEAKRRGAEVTSNFTLEKWLESLPEKERAKVKGDVELAYHATAPCWIDHWFMDYVELKPGQWFPKTQGFAYFGEERFDGTAWVEDAAKPIEMFRVELLVSEVAVDEKFEDAKFVLEIPQGASVREEK